ncbi:MAG: XRE family transcriptional regulator [Bacteriovoracaceae bacterium]|nr:XRE family transcriptional regulator [Bacteriovoracaceae bacterium]
MSELTDIKSTITEYRKLLRLGQKTVADHLGVSKSVMSAIESDPNRRIEINEIIKLSSLFMCSTDELLGFKGFYSKKLAKELSYNTRLTNLDKDLDQTDKAEMNLFHHQLIAFNTKFPYTENKVVEPTEKIRTQAVEDLLKLINSRTAPVDVYSIASKLHIFVKCSVLNNLSGALIHSKKVDGKFKNGPGILLNSNQPESRIRFSLAHEVAHFYLGHYKEETIGVSELGRRFSQIEKDADDFASELLMPTKYIHEEFNKLGVNKLSAQDVYVLSENFIVSFQAMLIKLQTLGYISQSQKETYSSMKVSDIKKGISGSKKDEEEFKPEILTDLMEKNNFSFEDLNIDSIRLLQEMAYEKYQAEVPFNKRKSEVKKVYEETVKWLSEAKKNSLNKNVAEVAKKILDANDIKYVDKTPSNGCLWVVFSEEAEPVIERMKRMNIHFTLAKKGGKATNYQEAWWLRIPDKKNSEVE